MQLLASLAGVYFDSSLSHQLSLFLRQAPHWLRVNLQSVQQLLTMHHGQDQKLQTTLVKHYNS